jgi:predicted RND superfamily exporter protein
MAARLMRYVSRLVVGHPGLVAAISIVLTIFLYAHSKQLRLGTDLTDLFGNDDPQWKAVSKMGNELGYGNQLFVLIEGPDNGSDATEQIEEMADRLSSDMVQSGMFQYVRSGLKEEELLKMVRLFAWNFPFFAHPNQWPDVKQRLDPHNIPQEIRTSGSELVTSFSALGTNYFVTDPLGLMEVVARGGGGFSQFASFDLAWGSGNRFFSKDHKALLIIAEPRVPAVDYQFAQRMVDWTRQHIAQIGAEPALRDSGIRAMPAGAYVYAEEEHKFIEKNIRLISIISIMGNLLLCLAIYPRIPLLLLSLLPTSLGILWTAGVASFYPGEVNLISLSFIAILAGLGDDQVVHFFNRVPQEWAKAANLDSAMIRTYDTTGASILLCILTAATATAALAMSSFKALSEFGFILTVGMVMMMLHTLFTVPALMRLWWRFSKPRAPETITFRFLPFLARHAVDFVGRHPRGVAGVSLAAFTLSLVSLPAVKMNRKIEVTLSDDNPAIAGQNRLSARFGIEGSPDVLLISGSEDEVLERAEELTGGLEDYQRRGVVKSVFSPAGIVPSRRAQIRNAQPLANIDLNATARALEDSIRERGFRTAPFQPFIDRLRELARGPEPLDVEEAGEYLPQGLLDNSIRKTGDGAYVGVVAYYATDPNATQVVPDSVLASWRRQFGPFVDFSFNKINRDVQGRVLRDSRRAMLWTAGGIILIVYLCFRNVRVSFLVLLPIAFAIIVTFGLLLLAGHHFSFMAITAIPLIIGIGIDNGIHLVRRYRESDDNNILDIAKASGAALIQSNLTTIVGFGALMAASFQPLAEMGLVTALGVVLALVGGLLVVPAVILITGRHGLGLVGQNSAARIIESEHRSS